MVPVRFQMPACVLLVTLAAALRLAWIGHDSLWIDELFSIAWSQLDLQFILTDGMRLETNPPAFYALLHGWVQLFGSSELSIRIPSALASAATVPVTYAIGLRLLTREAALFAGLLLAIDPVAITYAQEARAYALSALIDGVALLALFTNLTAFAFLAATAISLHYTSIFFVAACLGTKTAPLMLRRPLPVRHIGRWIAAALAILVLASPLLIAAVTLAGSSNLVWIGPQTGWTVLYFFLSLLAPLPSFETSCLGAAALSLVIALGVFRERPLPAAPIFWVAAVYCLLFIAAGWFRPMLLSRVATWLEIPVCLLLADAAMAQPAGWRRWAACAVPLLIFSIGTITYFRTDNREDWRSAAALVTKNPVCHGPLLVSEFNALGLWYYGVYPGKLAYVFLPDARRHGAVEFYLSERLMHLPELDPTIIPGFIRGHPGAALIMRAEYATVIPPELQAMIKDAPLQRTLAGGLTVACFR